MKRWLRILKWCVLALLGTVGILLTASAIWTTGARTRLAEKLAELRAAGEPTSLAELARVPIPPEQNAQTYLLRVQPALEAIEQMLLDAESVSPREDQEAFDNGRPRGTMLETLRAALVAHPEAMSLAKQASFCCHLDAGFDFHSGTDVLLNAALEQTQPCRRVFRVASYQVRLDLIDGQPERAMETCLMMLRLARLFDQNQLIMNQLVSWAVRGVANFETNRVLQTGALPASLHTALDEQLAAESRHLLDAERSTIRSERAFAIEYFDELSWSGPTALPSRLLPEFKNDECDCLDITQKAIEISSLPYDEWRRQFDAWKPGQEFELTALFAPSLQDAHLFRLRMDVQSRALRIINALVQIGPRDGSAVPNLADHGLPAEEIADPFTGEPMHVKKLPDGWLVYSVGPDLHDDGGDVYQGHKDIGFGPPPAVTDAASEKPSTPEPSP